VRVRPLDLGHRLTRREFLEDQFDGDPGARHHGFSEHDSRVRDDSGFGHDKYLNTGHASGIGLVF